MGRVLGATLVLVSTATFGAAGQAWAQSAVAIDTAALEALERDLEHLDVKALKDPTKVFNEHTYALAKALGLPQTAYRVYPKLETAERQRVTRIAQHLAGITRETFGRRREAPRPEVDPTKLPNETGSIVAILRGLDGASNQAHTKNGLEREFARALTKTMVPTQVRRESACDAICSTLAHMSDWAYDGTAPPRLMNNDALMATASWDTPIAAMEALFVAEAASLCPKVADRSKLLENALARWSKALTNIDRVPDGKYSAYAIHFSSLLVSRLPEIAKSHPDLEKAIAKHHETSLPKARLDALLGRQSQLLKNWVRFEYQFGGSSLDMHSLMVVIGAHRPGGGSPEARAAIDEIVAKNEAYVVPFDGVYPPDYAPHRYVGPHKRIVSPRSAAARGVPYEFAKFTQHGYRKEDLNSLLTALETYADYSGDLLYHVPRDGTHIGDDQVAPYYYAPTTVVATTAAQLAFAVAEGEQKNRARAVLERVTAASLAAYRGNGQWTHSADANDPNNSYQSSVFGRASRAFGTALPALSLAPACREDGSVGAYAGTVPSKLQKDRAVFAHGGGNGGEPPMDGGRIRPTDDRSPELALGQALREGFPTSAADVPAWLKTLGENNGTATIEKLQAALGAGPDAPERKSLLLGLGNPPETTLKALEVAMATRRAHNDPGTRAEDPRNQRWLALLAAEDRPAMKRDNALVWLHDLRRELKQGDEGVRRAYRKVADFAFNVPTVERKALAQALNDLKLDGSPAEDGVLRKALVAALERCPSIRTDGPGNGALENACIAAKVYAERWQRTLREALQGPQHTAHLDSLINVYEETDDAGHVPQMTTRAWGNALIERVGEPELRRWADRAGGEVGTKVHVLLDYLRGGATTAPPVRRVASLSEGIAAPR